METRTVESYRLDIHLAGDPAVIERVALEHCYSVGLCVTVIPQRFLYTGGREDGARVGLLNYPRFPGSREELWAKARALADLLMRAACQHSVLIEGPDRTEWTSVARTEKQ